MTVNGAEKIRWDLSDLYLGVDDPALDEDLNSSTEKAKTFVDKYKGKLASLTPTQLGQAFEMLEDILGVIYKISQYSRLIYAIDTADQSYKNLLARVDEAVAKLSNQLVFFDLEIGEMSESQFKPFDGASELNLYSYNLNRIRETAHFNLTEKEEKVITLKNLTGVKGFRKLYEELTSSFVFEMEVDGKRKKMNESELRSLRTHQNPQVRRKAMKLLFNRFEEQELVVTHIYNNIVKNHGLNQEMREYPSPISLMNINNDLKKEAVEALHKATTDSYPVVQRYYKLKAKILDLPDFTLADIYAPIPESDQIYTWDEAKSIVLDGFKAFDQEFYEMALLMFEEKRIDAPVAPTKRGGAFCSGSTPDIKPYVMLNFLGKPRDVATMAHELGHAIHDMLCSHNRLVNFHPILPLAETASVFSEMIITERLLAQVTDPKSKLAILTHKLEDIFATSHRQNMFSRFEMQAHDQISKQLMSSQDLCDLYKGELQKLFGESVRYPDEFVWEWSSIPHIFEVPFYVYAYNFGNLLVMALYEKYKEEGASFVPKLKAMLGMGQSASPEAITKLVDIDITDPTFWSRGLLYIEKWVNDLEALAK